MSFNPDDDSVVPQRPYSAPPEGEQPAPAPVEPVPAAQPWGGHPASAPVEPVPAAQPWSGHPAPTATPIGDPGVGQPAAVAARAPEAQPAMAEPQPVPPPGRERGRRGWVVPVAVGVVGLIVAGTLGYFLYTTTGQRDSARRQAASTQSTLTSTAATLATTQGTLTATQQDLTSRTAIAAYASMYVADEGRMRIDFEKLATCTSFGTCRSAAQSGLTDAQAFQSDRAAATVPAKLANSDAALRDSLSAVIAADQEIISGLDTFSASRITAGGKKLDAALLSLAKADAALGPELK